MHHFFGLLSVCDCSSYDTVLEPSLNMLVHSTIRYFSAFIVARFVTNASTLQETRTRQLRSGKIRSMRCSDGFFKQSESIGPRAGNNLSSLVRNDHRPGDGISISARIYYNTASGSNRKPLVLPHPQIL